jgi:hypothetical protein
MILNTSFGKISNDMSSVDKISFNDCIFIIHSMGIVTNVVGDFSVSQVSIINDMPIICIKFARKEISVS